MFYARKVARNKETIDELAFPSLDQQLEKMLDDAQFQEYLQKLSDNALVTNLKNQLALISGETLIKTYGYRKAAILGTLFAGAVVSFIGSLTFLVGERFPKEFGEFAGISVNEEAATGAGKFLGWTNVAIEAIFYTWTISGILPSFQPKQKQDKLPEANNPSFFRRCYNKLVSYLPSIGEWSLAIASTIPLTFLSWIDEEKTDKDNTFKYSIVASIAIITFVSNKYFLTLTHKQFKAIWNWLWSKNVELLKDDNNILQEVKNAFLEATNRAHERLHHLSKDEFQSLVSSLKHTSRKDLNLESGGADKRWESLLSIVLEDLSYVPKKTNKSAVILVPGLAIFAALSWLGLIATVPNGIKEKVSSSAAVQYLLMVIAGIPLIEIGLSAGGSVGLQLSKIGRGFDPLISNLAGFKTRLLGYIPLCLFGLFSFGTNATLTVQEFKSVPAVTWLLLPSATLGIDLINIFAGMELWDQISISVNIALNKDKQLFIKHQNFIKELRMEVEKTSPESLSAVLIKMGPRIQDHLKQLIPTFREKETIEFITSIAKQLHLNLPEKQKKRRKKSKQKIKKQPVHNKPLTIEEELQQNTIKLSKNLERKKSQENLQSDEKDEQATLKSPPQPILYEFNKRKTTKQPVGSDDTFELSHQSAFNQNL